MAEVESSLESAIARPATVHQGVKATESQKENKILGQKKMNVVLSLKMAEVEKSSLKSAIARPATVHQGVKVTESQKENKILGGKKVRVVQGPKMA